MNMIYKDPGLASTLENSIDQKIPELATLVETPKNNSVMQIDTSSFLRDLRAAICQELNSYYSDEVSPKIKKSGKRTTNPPRMLT